MAALLARLADAASRRRRIVIGAWLALLVAGGWFSLHQSDRLSGGGWEVPGSPSVRVSDALDSFPSFSSPALSVLVTGRSPAAVQRRLAAVRATTARDPNLRPDRPRLFAAGRAALLPVTSGGPTGDPIDVATRARHALVETTPETRTRLIGQPAIWSNFQEVAKRQLARGETTGFPLILIILLAGFGTLVAGLAPVAVGFAAVFLTGAVVYWLSRATEMSIDVNAVRSMAIGAIVVVSIAVLATVTLLPALLGPGVERFRIRLPWRTGESGDPVFWRRWTESVMAHPVRALALVVPFLLLLAAPLLAIKTYNRGLEQLPRNSEVRQATEQAKRFAGPGFSGPVHLLVDGRAGADRLASRLARIQGVARVTPPLAGPDGRRFLVSAYLASDPESPAAHATLRRIERAAPEATIGGATQFGRGVNGPIFGGLPKMLLFILAVSYVVLLVLLGSVLLPLKAILMNLLSVGAAYGALVAVFQWGWLDWIGYSSPGYVDTIVPALVLHVTFGLSMDYEVFLLTRIRERYMLHGRNDQAVAEGLVGSARIITSAALVMVAVFAAFAVAGTPSLRELGVGLAVAVGLDATIVRLVVVPATMRLLGDWNWWVPRRLAKLLPAPAPLG